MWYSTRMNSLIVLILAATVAGAAIQLAGVILLLLAALFLLFLVWIGWANIATALGREEPDAIP